MVYGALLFMLKANCLQHVSKHKITSCFTCGEFLLFLAKNCNRTYRVKKNSCVKTCNSILLEMKNTPRLLSTYVTLMLSTMVYSSSKLGRCSGTLRVQASTRLSKGEGIAQSNSTAPVSGALP